MLLSGHDMYLKMDTYFQSPHSPARIKLFNGTFDLSENTIDRNRMIDVSLVGNGERVQVDTTQWREEGGMTILDIQTGESGTWVAGVSTRARNIEMTAEDFNGYLEHDGVLDMLEWRKENNAMDQDAVEKYAKHVKALFQVGSKKTDDWQTILGYPIEFVPLNNPYNTHVGHEIEVKLLWKGEPLANQLVYLGSSKAAHSHDHADEEVHEHSHEGEHTHDTDDADHAHSHDHADGETQEHSHGSEEVDHHHDATQLRTDDNGVLKVMLSDEGIYYLRTIHLVPSEEEGLTHESNWATLTFEVGHDHSHSHGEEAHHHEHEEGGLPSYAYWVISLAVIAGLFFWFNRKA